jgi:uncharacterized ion transporter superfamily protein YfcC
MHHYRQHLHNLLQIFTIGFDYRHQLVVYLIVNILPIIIYICLHHIWNMYFENGQLLLLYLLIGIVSNFIYRPTSGHDSVENLTEYHINTQLPKFLAGRFVLI